MNGLDSRNISPPQCVGTFAPPQFVTIRHHPLDLIQSEQTNFDRENESRSRILGKRVRVESAAPTEPEKRINLDPTTADLKTISGDDFQLLLKQAYLSQDPFQTLLIHFTPKLNDPNDDSFKNSEYWSCLIRLDKDCVLECQLAHDKWSSTSFGKTKKGKFRYIELFDHDPATGKTENKSLITIRLSEDHQKGEWLWINRGKNIPGKKAKTMAEEISRAMKIKKCYLSDSATVTSIDGKDIAIRIPLQVIFGKGFYANPFSLVHTKKPKLAGLNINDDSTNDFEDGSLTGLEQEASIPINYDQNVDVHQKELKWLQELKVKTIYNQILNKGTENQVQFAALVERYAPKINGKKGLPLSLFNRCKWSFRTMMKELYERKNKCPQALADYEWVYFNLLDYTKLTDASPIQERYAWFVEKLFFNMLMIADFSKSAND